MNHINHTMHDFYVLLKRQYEIYEIICTLCQEDRQFIERDEIDLLRQSIGKKHVLLNDIMCLEKDIATLKEEWNRYKEKVCDPLKTNILSLLNDFKALMEKIVTYQKENEKILFERNSKHVEELNMVRKGKNLSKAYSVYGNSIPHSRFMDKVK